MPSVKVNNIEIYYEVHGEGEPMILISGLAGDSQSWQFSINTFSNHFKTIIFDNRGVGRSDSPSPPYSIEEMAKDVIGLLDFMDINSAHIVGHSMGGYIAQQIAIQYPERVKKLVLESTAPFSSRRNIGLFRNFYNCWRSGIDMELWLQQFYYWVLSQKSVEDKKFFDSIVKYTLDYPYPQPLEGFLGQINAIENFDVNAHLNKIVAETLIVIGEEDILIKPKEAELLYQGITHASYPSYIEKVGHSAHLEAPKAFTNTVLGFLYKYVR
ncbi:MAG: alpha/beta hydrolase [Bacteroidales bacterium]|nr:alpha/beta hydrolase [Bacteroidales bacterium]MCF8396615.1 alpha/beta hydrolase [Bacteroidales bacterium]